MPRPDSIVRDDTPVAPRAPGPVAPEAPGPVAPGLDQFLCFAIYSASHALTRFYKPHLDALGLTYPQYLALLALGEVESMTVGQVGARLFLDSNTLTPLLKRMETAGLLLRARDGADERQVHVRLTAAGRDVLERTRFLPGCVAAAAQQSEPTLVALRDGMHAIRQALASAD